MKQFIYGFMLCLTSLLTLLWLARVIWILGNGMMGYNVAEHMVFLHACGSAITITLMWLAVYELRGSK